MKSDDILFITAIIVIIFGVLWYLVYAKLAEIAQTNSYLVKYMQDLIKEKKKTAE